MLSLCAWFWVWGWVGVAFGFGFGVWLGWGPVGVGGYCLRVGYRLVVEKIHAQHLCSASSPLIDKPLRPLFFVVADLIVACNGLVLHQRLAMQAALVRICCIALITVYHTITTLV